uniref:Activating signal cointegrator 1 N-terminal domain-containing protein n=1 Tax=Knipowitschia caucasica TaxID=637954 RepID=A0AAV2LTM8_KNICA
MSESLFQWCVEQLHHRFGLEACEDIVKYILTIENREELEEYVGDLLQGTDGRKRHFLDELLKRWERSQRPSVDPAGLFVRTESAPSAADFERKAVLGVLGEKPQPPVLQT